MILPILASQVARIIGASHQHVAILLLLLLMWFWLETRALRVLGT
jgi:hypothetical protein